MCNVSNVAIDSCHDNLRVKLPRVKFRPETIVV